MKTKMESRKTQLEEEDQGKKTNYKRRIEGAKLEGSKDMEIEDGCSIMKMFFYHEDVHSTKVRGRN